jgi:hypothetical protein
MVYLLYSVFPVPKRQTEAMTSWWYYLINWCIETLLCSHVLEDPLECYDSSQDS